MRQPFVLSFLIFNSLFGEIEGTPTTAATLATIRKQLSRISEWRDSDTEKSSQPRPFVTVTFAQSIDGKIALFVDESGDLTTANFPLSGPESLLLTHGLRSLHDGVLVGGRTLSIDNPRLSNRLWSLNSNVSKQPRPIVLDTNLRHLKRVLSRGMLNANNLIVCCSSSALRDEEEEDLAQLATVVSFLPCRVDPSGELDLLDVLQRLRDEFDIKSLMVEGGSQVISSFIRLGVMDCLCITIAPKFLGPRGLSTLCFDTGSIQEFQLADAFTLGSDCILIVRGPNTGE
jgi:riboflavin-specific deaminase-like protein